MSATSSLLHHKLSLLTVSTSSHAILVAHKPLPSWVSCKGEQDTVGDVGVFKDPLFSCCEDLTELSASGVTGNDAEAEDCFAQGLQLVEAVTGPGHDDAVFSLGAYAAFLKSVPPCIMCSQTFTWSCSKSFELSACPSVCLLTPACSSIHC